MVGGMQPVATAYTHTNASIAPAAPIAWPVIDLVLDTASRGACSPQTWLIAIVSYQSLSGVEVLWALM